MKIRFSRDSNLFPMTAREFNTQSVWAAAWSYKFNLHGVVLTDPAGTHFFMPYNNIDWVVYDGKDTDVPQFEQSHVGLRQPDRDRGPQGNVGLCDGCGCDSLGSRSPNGETLDALSESAGLLKRPLEEEGSDLHPTSGEDVRVPAPRRRGRGK
jgi:hypothetical protein